MQFVTLEPTLHEAEFRQPLEETELKKIDAYWRAANYLSIGQICISFIFAA